jgi:acetyl esterase/lipase
MNLLNSIRTLGLWLDPLRQALFAPGIRFTYRWRLLVLQQINLIVLPLKTLPWTFSKAYRIIWIPSRGGSRYLRALVFEPSNLSTPQYQQPRLKPLHIDFHAGAFTGGHAEVDNAFCHTVCQRTGAVVVSVDYRVAPQHIYPAAHEDCEDAVEWLLVHAREEFGADPGNLTVSGFSAGGNLMMVAGRRARAAVGVYGSVSTRCSDKDSGV